MLQRMTISSGIGLLNLVSRGGRLVLRMAASSCHCRNTLLRFPAVRSRRHPLATLYHRQPEHQTPGHCTQCGLLVSAHAKLGDQPTARQPGQARKGTSI